jgi:hypothetical protein
MFASATSEAHKTMLATVERALRPLQSAPAVFGFHFATRAFARTHPLLFLC